MILIIYILAITYIFYCIYLKKNNYLKMVTYKDKNLIKKIIILKNIHK